MASLGSTPGQAGLPPPGASHPAQCPWHQIEPPGKTSSARRPAPHRRPSTWVFVVLPPARIQRQARVFDLAETFSQRYCRYHGDFVVNVSSIAFRRSAGTAPGPGKNWKGRRHCGGSATSSPIPARGLPSRAPAAAAARPIESPPPIARHFPEGRNQGRSARSIRANAARAASDPKGTGGRSGPARSSRGWKFAGNSAHPLELGLHALVFGGGPIAFLAMHLRHRAVFHHQPARGDQGRNLRVAKLPQQPPDRAINRLRADSLAAIEAPTPSVASTRGPPPRRRTPNQPSLWCTPLAPSFKPGPYVP